MKYLYKNGRSFIYKRRLPNSDHFYTFNTKTKNAKIAQKVVNRFNRVSSALFEFLRYEGMVMNIDMNEVFDILDSYKKLALEENSDYEYERHKHLADLFGIKEQDPLAGMITLDGSDARVIEQALSSFSNLAHSDMYKNKKVLLKLGKEIVKRSTVEVKNLFSKLRSNEEDLLTFIVILIKAESELLKVDYKRAEERFNPINTTSIDNSSEEEKSYTEEQKRKNTSLQELREEFLFSHCLYETEDLSNSKTQCSKMNKIVELVIDYAKSKKIYSVQDLDVASLKAIYQLILDIPRKVGNVTEGYRFFDYYSKLKNSAYEKRGVSTIENDLLSHNRFVKYLKIKKYISVDDFEECQNHFANIKKKLVNAVKNNEIADKKNVSAYSVDMLKCLFDPEKPAYKIVIETLLEKRTLRKGACVDDYWARFYVPLILFFTGARVSEISFLKTSDCEIREFSDGVERIILYVIANEKRPIKTGSSRRIILIHDFLAKNLGLLQYIKRAKSERREYIFNVDRDLGSYVGKEFNRKKINSECVEKYYTREDEFNLVKHSLHSFRHTYKTTMLLKKYSEGLVNKIQGHKEESVSMNYFTTNSEEIVEMVNGFDLYKRIDWSIFKVVPQFI